MDRNEKDLLWEWVMYLDLCALHGSVPVPIMEPMTYGLWKAIKEAQQVAIEDAKEVAQETAQRLSWELAKHGR